MAVSKNKDRRTFDQAFDLDPQRIQCIFSSANTGYVKPQSRLASELTEKDPAIAQAWSVRVAAIAACPYEIVGGTEEQRLFIESSLRDIQPSYDSNLSTFSELLQFLQSAVMHGFALANTKWGFGGGSIEGFEIFAQSLFSYTGEDLPYFQPDNIQAGNTESKIFPAYPNWIYHTATNSRDSEPLRSGIVRPLAYLYAFRRHVQIEYMSGLEKYGVPMPFVGVEGMLFDDSNPQKVLVEEMMSDWTYNGYAILDKDSMDVTFPTAASGFNADDFLNFLEMTEKQIFRIILGQDSTSSADNSNRSTAQVHNLVRADMLASDANAVEETVNNQIIKPLFDQNGFTGRKPRFRFKLKGVTELAEMAKVVETLSKAGYEIEEEALTEKFGFKVSKIVEESEETVSTEDGEERVAKSKRLKFESLKGLFDAYGVGVRAGSITPQTSDEEFFRELAELPDMSNSVEEAWVESDGIRRPTTLKSPAEVEEGAEVTTEDTQDVN